MLANPMWSWHSGSNDDARLSFGFAALLGFLRVFANATAADGMPQVLKAPLPSKQTMNMGTVMNLRICESVVEIGTNNVLTLSIFAWRPRGISKPCWGTGGPWSLRVDRRG